MERNAYKDAIETWGEFAQLDQMIEEMAELTVAINKYKRKFSDSLLDEQKANVMSNLYEEFADVKLMLNQMEFMFGKENIERAYKKKFEKFEIELYGKNCK